MNRLVLLFGGLCVLLLLFNSQRAASPSSLKAIDTSPPAAELLAKYFPQTTRCHYERWGVDYANMHADIVAGRTVPRYLVSVAGYHGLADRMTGVVTQFYLALLSKRAFTTVSHSYLPPLEAACAQPYVNWTHPQAFPKGVLSQDFLGHDDPTEPDQLPATGPVNNSWYHRQSMMNTLQTPAWLGSSNLSLFPSDNPHVAYVLSLNNRGDTHAVLNNPHHKQMWMNDYGLTPHTAFMCSWFYLFAPNKAVQEMFQHKWAILRDNRVLKIGIQVRLGDGVFNDQHDLSRGQQQLEAVKPYFDCAQRLERAFAAPGQKVVWYLIADARPLRVAAAERFSPNKLLTDTTSASWHIDCFVHNPKACNKETMELTIQQAIGEILTFSLTDYQIVTKRSGFGRVGAWLSGKSGNLFEFDLDPGLDLSEGCNPHKPTPPQLSANSWSRI